MVKDDSNESDAMTIAGILVSIGIIAIFVAFAFGVMGSNNFLDEGVQVANTETPSASENSVSEYSSENIPKTSPGSGDVSVDKRIDDTELYNVESGKTELVDDNIESPLPICISPEWAEDKWVVFRSLGGYDLIGGMLYITQYGDIVKNPCIPGMYVGYGLTVTDNWWECTTDNDGCYCWHYFNVSFDTTCNNKVCLDSTTDPEGKNYQEHKQVSIYYNTLWEGCYFCQILIHKNHILGIPNSRINI